MKMLFVFPVMKKIARKKILYIKNYLKDEGIEFNTSELNILSNSLPNERLEIKRELEKIIILFKGFGKQKSFDFSLSIFLNQIIVINQNLFSHCPLNRPKIL